MSADLEALCAGLAGEGTTEAADLGFTLESAKAREKLQEFALAQPENFQLLALAGLCALGCHHFKVTIDADDFVIAADQPLKREPFEDLWSFVSRGGADAEVIGFRLLAMALLTSVRLGEMEWSVESADAAGGWRHEAIVRRGLLTEKKPFSMATPPPGVILRAKRKAVSQVARRFLTRWLSGALKGERGGSDEALLKERLILPAGSSLECNGHLLTVGDQPAAGVLAVLSTGEAPSLVACPVVHKRERDYAMTILLCEPKSHNDPGLPGSANHTTWIWNGLRMDSTVLGAELDCMRAFVWAPELRPDLSFTSLADNRDKQTLERTVRAQARELLDRWVREFSAQIQAAPITKRGSPGAQSAPFQQGMAIVRNAIRERIDTRKDWRRFASLNRALLEFPLVLGSGADGRRRWISMAEILGELQAGRQVAAFSRDSEAEDVPAWPGRPLVLYTDKSEVDFLRPRFSQFELASGLGVLCRVRDRLSSKPMTHQPPTTDMAWLSGQVELGPVRLEWTLDRQRSSLSQPGQLWVHFDEGSFCDESLALPCGLIAQARVRWEQSYRGELMDRRLAAEVKRALMTSVAQAIAARGGEREQRESSQNTLVAPAQSSGRAGSPAGESSPDAEGYALSGLVLAALNAPDQLDAAAQDAAWLVVQTLGGDLRWMTPKDLKGTLDVLEAPLYAAGWPFTPPVGLPPEWAELPVALVPKTCEPGLAHLLSREANSAQGLDWLDKQAPAPRWNNENLLWTGTLQLEEAGEVDRGLRSMTLGILRAVPKDGQVEVQESLFGRYIRKGSYSGVPAMLRVAVDWAQGWPDSTGDKRAESNARAARLKKGYLALLQRFFTEMPAPELRGASPHVIGGLMFEVLADNAAASLPLFLLGDGRRVSLSEVPSRQGEVRYFTYSTGSAPADAVYLPGPMQEAIELVSDLRWVAVQRETEPSPKPAPVPGEPSPEVVKPTPRVAKPADPRPAPAPKAATARPDVEAPSANLAVPSGAPIPLPKPEKLEPEAAPLEPEGPAASKPVSEPAPPPIVEIAGPAPAASPLEIELAELPLGSEFEWRDFTDFVAGTRLDDSQKMALRMDGERAVLGKPCEKALKTSHGRKILLVTLFSIFRRQTGKVGLEEALCLHHAILTTTIRGRPKS